MSKKIFIACVVVAVVLVIGAFLSLRGTSKPSQENANVPVEEKTTEQDSVALPVSETGRDTMEALMSRQDNLECRISYTGTEGSSESVGTFFTSRERMRGDFEIEDSGKKILSSMIIVDKKMYSWTEIDGQKYGMQVDLTELEKIEGNKPDTKEPIPLNEKVNYECKTWVSIDSSVFEPPTDIVFTDFGQVLKAGMEYGTSYEGEGTNSADNCAMCQSLPEGESRVQCLKAMSCQ